MASGPTGLSVKTGTAWGGRRSGALRMVVAYSKSKTFDATPLYSGCTIRAARSAAIET
jgi:hypothetical protein